MAIQQLPLGVTFREDAVFEDYLPGDNAQTLGALRHALARLDETLIYLWGASGSGLTHLLQACVHDLQSQGLESLYLPLADCVQYGPDALEGLDEMAVLALDDIDSIAGLPDWEEALFHLFNRMRDSGRVLLVTSHTSPLHPTVALPDRSRCLAVVVVAVTPCVTCCSRTSMALSSFAPTPMPRHCVA